MAESPETSAMEKSLISVKSEPPKEPKKKRKRSSKKFSRTKFSEEMETKSQESLTGGGENKENSEEYEAERTETIKEIEQNLTSVEEELKAKEKENVEGEATKQDLENNDELMNRESTQDSNGFEESGELKEEGKADDATPNQQAHNKKSKRPSLKFLRPSKRNAKGKLSSGGTKRVGGQAEKTAENNDVKGKAMENNFNEQQEEIQDETKFEQDATREDTESKDEENSLEGTLERSHGKSDKEKNLKKFASFGRSKKKPDIAINKPKEIESADTETSELEKEEETSDAKSGDKKGQNIESQSNEPTTLDTNESVNEPLDKEKEEGEDKEAGHVKRKASLLGFKRNKQSKKRRSLKNGEQMTAEADQSEIAASKTDNAAAEEEQLKEADDENAEKNNEDNKDDKEEDKPANLQVKETMEGSTKEDTDEWEEKAEQENEESKRGSLTKNRRSRILRSFKKLRSPRKKMQENEKAANEEDGTKKTEQLNDDENSDFTQSTEDHKSDHNNSEECSPKAVKRKTSDLKNMDVIQASKKKKEDDVDEDYDQVRNEEFTAEKNETGSKVEDKERKLKEVSSKAITCDELLNEAETQNEARQNMKTVMNELADFMEKREEEIADEDEEEEDESYDSDLTIVSEITVLSSAYELTGDQKSPLNSKREEFRGTFVRESVNTKRLQLVEVEPKDDPETEHEGKYEEYMTEKRTEDTKESSVKYKSEVAEPEIQPVSERSVTENDKRDSSELEDTITVANQEVEVFSTPDTEPPAEDTAQTNTEELPKTDTKDTDESSEADVSQNLGSKQNGKAEPQSEDSDSDSKSSDEIITQVDDTDQDKKKTGKDSFSSNPKAWIMVQHLEMNEDISRQLGHMLSINAFKRTTSCCTII